MRDISLHDLIPTGDEGLMLRPDARHLPSHLIPTGAEGLMLRQDARHLPSHLIPTGDEGLMPRPEARHLPVHPPTPYHPPPSRCVSPFRFAGCPATELGCRDKAGDRNPEMHTSAFEKEKSIILHSNALIDVNGHADEPSTSTSSIPTTN